MDAQACPGIVRKLDMTGQACPSAAREPGMAARTLSCAKLARRLRSKLHEGGAAEGRPPFVEAAEGRLPLWVGLAGVQASSIKEHAIKPHGLFQI